MKLRNRNLIQILIIGIGIASTPASHAGIFSEGLKWFGRLGNGLLNFHERWLDINSRYGYGPYGYGGYGYGGYGYGQGGYGYGGSFGMGGMFPPWGMPSNPYLANIYALNASYYGGGMMGGYGQGGYGYPGFPGQGGWGQGGWGQGGWGQGGWGQGGWGQGGWGGCNCFPGQQQWPGLGGIQPPQPVYYAQNVGGPMGIASAGTSIAPPVTSVNTAASTSSGGSISSHFSR